MIAFLDLVLPKAPSNSFSARSRLQIFACRKHDDIAGTIYSDPSEFFGASEMRQLPGEYWNVTDGHYLLRLLPPNASTWNLGPETRLVPQFVSGVEIKDGRTEGFKRFGEPNWLQGPEEHECACGAPMELLLQIPDGWGFKMADGAEEQPNSFSKTDYCLFLGNQLLLFACSKQCHPLALWPVLEN